MIDVLQEARLGVKFVEIGKVLGAAQRFQSLGDNLYMQNQYGKTTAVLKEARVKFIGLGDVRKFDPIASWFLMGVHGEHHYRCMSDSPVNADRVLINKSRCLNKFPSTRHI